MHVFCSRLDLERSGFNVLVLTTFGEEPVGENPKMDCQVPTSRMGKPQNPIDTQYCSSTKLIVAITTGDYC